MFVLVGIPVGCCIFDIFGVPSDELQEMSPWSLQLVVMALFLGGGSLSWHGFSQWGAVIWMLGVCWLNAPVLVIIEHDAEGRHCTSRRGDETCAGLQWQTHEQLKEICAALILCKLWCLLVCLSVERTFSTNQKVCHHTQNTSKINWIELETKPDSWRRDCSQNCGPGSGHGHPQRPSLSLLYHTVLPTVSYYQLLHIADWLLIIIPSTDTAG